MSTPGWHDEPIVLRIAKAVAEYIGFGEDDIPHPDSKLAENLTFTERPVVKPALRLMPQSSSEEQQSSHKWRRHPQLRAYESPLSGDTRDGRHQAVRGLFAAREGALDVALAHFTSAARCEEVDLTAVPGFWNLTRGQMQTAVDAYEAAGRYRDAAALDANIATIFRPSLVGAPLQPIVPRKPQRQAAST